MINKNDIIRIWITDTAIWLQLKDKRQSRELFADYPRLANAPCISAKITQYRTLAYIGQNLMKICRSAAFSTSSSKT